MKISFHVQAPGAKADASLQSIVSSKIRNSTPSETLIAVAYMTISGVRALLPNLMEAPPQKSKWLIGLDDFVTQPGAIEVVRSIPGSEVRVVSYRELGLRFHPKVYIFRWSEPRTRALLILGSSNLTAHALNGNAEANVSVEPKTASNLVEADSLWKKLWRLGHSPTPGELARYEEDYTKTRLARLRTGMAAQPKQRTEILSTDEAVLDPGRADLCWIECGYITAMGREIEFKAEQGLFFGLNPNGGKPRFFSFLVSNGNSIRLRMKYQKNHMWRLQLTSAIPEVASGLRPVQEDGSLGRSPYVAVIERTQAKTTYRLRFVGLTSRDFRRLESKSRELGTLGRTSARKYGWC
ncbi:MAG: phospholipase D-like domain-containing protein [Rhodanobacter sp.]